MSNESGQKIKATEIAAGVTLLTRDGETNGNAIVVSFNEEKGAWLIQSDYGSRFFLTAEEVMAKFKLGYQTTFIEWFGMQLSLILHNSPWPHLAKSINRDIAEKALTDFGEKVIESMAAIIAEKERMKALGFTPKRKRAKKKKSNQDSKRNGNALGKSFADIQSGSGDAGNIFDRVFNKQGARREKVTS